jgi:putative alpha-1,2-mannosidase
MDTNSDIMHGDGLYEGTLWQYRWFVTWDVPGLMELIGGEEEFVDQLTHFFDKDLYNHGNQPDIHAPFLFNFSDSPWKTQKWVNQILTKDMIQWYGTHDKWDEPYTGKIYKNSPQGYLFEMDEDMGTMSSWYVLSAIGIYPQNVGEPYYHLTSPNI